MKKVQIVLGASLAANAVLLILWWRAPVEKVALPAVTPSTTDVTPAAPTVETTEGTLTAMDSATPVRARELVTIDDLPELVHRLRAAGFDPMDIRAIVSARLNRIYGARRKAAVADLEVVPYWQSNSSFPYNPLAGAEIRGLFNEQNATMRRLLGSDFYSNDEWSVMLREREFGYLPAAKVDRLKGIMDDYKDLRAAIFNETRGMMLPEDRAKMQLIEQEQRADIEALFTPEELEAYDLHSSNTANTLRFQLRSFKPTEEEYRAIYKIARAAGTEQAPLNLLNQNQSADLRRQIEAVLSPERAAAFQMKTDPVYMQIDQIAPRLQLPETTVTQVYTATRDFQNRVQSLVSNPAIPADARNSQLRAIAIEAESRLTGLLGQTGFELYRSRAGQWLRVLQSQANQSAGASN